MSTSSHSDKKNVIVRQPPRSFANALTTSQFTNGEKPDYDLALNQHNQYVNTFKKLGLNVIVLEAEEEFPDCCFVEDQALIVDNHVFFPITGAPSRRGEQKTVVETITPHMKSIHWGQEPGRIDGGDVVRVGDIFYIGKSKRSNDEGISQFQDFLTKLNFESYVVNVPDYSLHLTTLCSSPNSNLLLIPESSKKDLIFTNLPESVEIITIPDNETYGCNTIGFEDKVIISEGYSIVKKILIERGFEIIELPMSEFRAVDGSLTCLSLFYK
ncbi:MAG: arginine deiminase-related protein [Candidatus Thermoplasmatota archaeon]|nr:arginine deiminase-related protein [Candidatus Thermoplasmatota archaeon]